MKLQGETTTNMREPSKALFFPVLRKSRVAPEQNGGTLSGRHLECEEGTYDRGIISRILRKVGALSSGESTFFRTRTYSPQRRSKSQERGSTALPIKPFSNREALPVLRNFKNVSTTQSYRRMDSCDTRRLSHPNVLPSGALQLATQKVEDKSKNKPRNSDDLPRKPSPVCAKDIKHSPAAVPTKLKPENNKCSTSEVASVFPESVQLKENSAAEPSEQLETEVKKDANKPSLHGDGSKNENGVKEVHVSNVGTLNGVTRIQVKYSAPTQQEIKPPTDNLEIPNKNAVVEVKLDSTAKAAQHENSKEIISKDIISESVNFSGFHHSAVATHDASKPNKTLTSSSSSSSSPTAPLYASSLRSVNANKASSKSNPGRLTIRPASNLNASKLKSEYLKLTQFNDIKVGQFSAPSKPKRQLKSEEEHDDDDDDLLIINETRAEGRWGNDNDDDDEEKFEFIGAGVIQGKSSLAKTKSKKQRSVIFSEVPVIHLIEDISASLAEETEENDDDNDDDGSTSYPAEAQGLFSSITSAASKGGLSSYKSKTLADFEFDFEAPPRQSKSTSPSDTCREQAREASHEEVLLWSSSGSIDLLF